MVGQLGGIAAALVVIAAGIAFFVGMVRRRARYSCRDVGMTQGRRPPEAGSFCQLYGLSSRVRTGIEITARLSR